MLAGLAHDQVPGPVIPIPMSSTIFPDAIETVWTNFGPPVSVMGHDDPVVVLLVTLASNVSVSV
jgi:hypothetical protein